MGDVLSESSNDTVNLEMVNPFRVHPHTHL